MSNSNIFQSSSKKKICFITGSRAEYGLLSGLIKILKRDNAFKVQIIVTGSHLHDKYGKTLKYIKKDGLTVDKKISILQEQFKSNGPSTTTKSTALALQKIGDALIKLKPNLVILLGDRYEILAAAIAASFHKVPICHFHGGEITEGAIDDSIRHSISKMSTLHFAANNIYRKRIIQMGENPNRVFNIGGMGIDIIKQTKLLNKDQLQKKLKTKFLDKIFIITFHPVTLEQNTAKKQMRILLKTVSQYKNTTLIITYPNADMYSDSIIKEIKYFVKNNNNALVYKSMGQEVYFSILKLANLVIGNSSSGIIEAPYFHTPTINIGNRQKGRVKAKSIIDVTPNSEEIKRAINRALSNRFSKIKNTNNYLYGKSGASKKSYNIIKKNINNLEVFKKFYDIEF